MAPLTLNVCKSEVFDIMTNRVHHCKELSIVYKSMLNGIQYYVKHCSRNVFIEVESQSSVKQFWNIQLHFFPVLAISHVEGSLIKKLIHVVPLL